MNRPMAFRPSPLLLILWITVVPATAQVAGPVTREQIEADWLRQAEVRTLPVAAAAVAVTPEQDAAGACDGVKDGTYGFHTNQDTNPWWQVDLKRPTPLDEVLVFNRCDGSDSRAYRLAVLLSLDGQTWETAYQHDGTPFFGQPDNRPLSVKLNGRRARYVRIQLSGETYLHLDEVEIYQQPQAGQAPDGRGPNVALNAAATQSSASPYSTRSQTATAAPTTTYPTAQVVQRGMKLAASLRRLDVDVADGVRALEAVEKRLAQQGEDLDEASARQIYLDACWAVRSLAFSNPLLDFDRMLLVKRVPAWFKTGPESRTYTHMSDQYYGWFSRPGGGLFLLEGFNTATPELRCLTEQLPPGNIIRPDVGYDGRRALFAFARYHEGISGMLNKLDKQAIPEDAFYQLYELDIDDGSMRRLTHGKYDHFDGRYLPDGRIVFLSTRRGQHVQCLQSTTAGAAEAALPDSFVRCGGDAYRPVSVYTLHVMDGDGGNITPISPFESFEWTPSVDNQGRILYARWDYVDRNNMPYMGLWATLPNGAGARAVFGNFTLSPHATFEPRAIPGSDKIIFTASAHHSNTSGSLVLLDLNRGADGDVAMTRLTPETPFPEVEAWPSTYYVNPFPLSEEHYLVTWSDKPLVNPGNPAGTAAMGIYLYDAFGNLNLIYRDSTISCMYPLPVRPRPRPPRVRPMVAEDEAAASEGSMLLVDVYQGLESIERGTIRRLRIVGVPSKTQPNMHSPQMGITRDDPGKFVMGTVPVERDGSAHFRVPAGVAFFLQALDEEGMAVQTMRTATYVQPGERLTCVGCHEPRNTAPPNVAPLAAARPASKITPGVEGSWPLDYQALVQPVLQSQCVACHQPGGEAAEFDLTAAKSYDSLINYGSPSVIEHVKARYAAGRSTAGQCVASASPLVALLREGHYDVQLAADEFQRLITWLDTYGQRTGSFSPEQEQALRELRVRMGPMLIE